MNNMEIERKYLIKITPSLCDIDEILIEQAYLCKKPEIRIRKKSRKDLVKYFLTIKEACDNESNRDRNEYEFEIDAVTFNSLYSKADCSIEKKRYEIPIDDGLIAEIDIYVGKENIVEVEFPDKEKAENFLKPDWFGDEVTNNPIYKNVNLAYSNAKIHETRV